MISGKVSLGLVPNLDIQVLDSLSRAISIQTSIDTGFNGELTLTSTQIAQLGLIRTGDVIVQLADGSFSKHKYYSAQVSWAGTIGDVQVILVESTPLVGLRLLSGYRLIIDVIGGGAVSVEPIP